MVGVFVSGVIIGATALTCWALSAANKVHKNEQENMPETVKRVMNGVKQHCANQGGCDGCGLEDMCLRFSESPKEWEDE